MTCARFRLFCATMQSTNKVQNPSLGRLSTILFSIILSTFNGVIPVIVRALVSYEKHHDEGSMQVSLYVKITFFRWVNTAIKTRLIT
jgi:hypothetical protein